ncbi:MAG: hypothetical protein KDJ16_03730 [Hyphomicrobiales bacterium]|nr:hypothetical protein [Hyphomicrobiales bacterium]
MIPILAAAIIAATAATAAAAQSASPYDTTYKAAGQGGKPVVMRAGPEQTSPAIGEIESGTTGIVMRWCRPEFNFGKWAFSSRDGHRLQLKDKACEVEVGGKVGFVDGADLSPEE